MRLIGQNSQYYIEQYNDQSHRLQPAGYEVKYEVEYSGRPEVCHQDIPMSTTQTVWTAELGPTGNSQTGIKLFTTDASGNKWYLRASVFGGAADLVCPDHFNNVSEKCIGIGINLYLA